MLFHLPSARAGNVSHLPGFRAPARHGGARFDLTVVTGEQGGRARGRGGEDVVVLVLRRAELKLRLSPIAAVGRSAGLGASLGGGARVKGGQGRVGRVPLCVLQRPA